MKKLKSLLSLLALGSMSVLSSCKKEIAQVEDNPNAMAAMSSVRTDQLGSSGTEFGAGIQGGSTNQRITVYNKFGVKYVRAMVSLRNFNGGVATEKNLSQQGFKVVLNINWGIPSGRGDNRKSVPFPTNMGDYRQQLTKLFNAYKPDIAVIENEPTTDLFHSGRIEDYITELRTAVDVCKQFNVKVADGAIHVPYIEQVMNGNAGNGKALDVKKLIEAYRTIDLDYVNVHVAGPSGKDPDTYEPGLLRRVANYLREETGKEIISNEWTVHDNSPALVRNMVNEFRDADFKVAMVRSANSPNGAVPLHRGTSLLPNGVTYSDQIR